MPSLLHRLIARAPQRVQRDTLEFELDDGRRVEVQRVRDPRARRLKLSVDERGARLTLPMRASLVAGERFLHETAFRAGDWLVFGPESRGLAPELREMFPPAQRLKLPMRPGQRSLNLSNAVAVAVFEAWRQNGFA